MTTTTAAETASICTLGQLLLSELDKNAKYEHRNLYQPFEQYIQNKCNADIIAEFESLTSDFKQTPFFLSVSDHYFTRSYYLYIHDFVVISDQYKEYVQQQQQQQQLQKQSDNAVIHLPKRSSNADAFCEFTVVCVNDTHINQNIFNIIEQEQESTQTFSVCIDKTLDRLFCKSSLFNQIGAHPQDANQYVFAVVDSQSTVTAVVFQDHSTGHNSYAWIKTYAIDHNSILYQYYHKNAHKETAQRKLLEYVRKQAKFIQLKLYNYYGSEFDGDSSNTSNTSNTNDDEKTNTNTNTDTDAAIATEHNQESAPLPLPLPIPTTLPLPTKTITVHCAQTTVGALREMICFVLFSIPDIDTCVLTHSGARNGQKRLKDDSKTLEEYSIHKLPMIAIENGTRFKAHEWLLSIFVQNEFLFRCLIEGYVRETVWINENNNRNNNEQLAGAIIIPLQILNVIFKYQFESKADLPLLAIGDIVVNDEWPMHEIKSHISRCPLFVGRIPVKKHMRLRDFSSDGRLTNIYFDDRTFIQNCLGIKNLYDCKPVCIQNTYQPQTKKMVLSKKKHFLLAITQYFSDVCDIGPLIEFVFEKKMSLLTFRQQVYMRYNNGEMYKNMKTQPNRLLVGLLTSKHLKDRQRLKFANVTNASNANALNEKSEKLWYQQILWTAFTPHCKSNVLKALFKPQLLRNGDMIVFTELTDDAKYATVSEFVATPRNWNDTYARRNARILFNKSLNFM